MLNDKRLIELRKDYGYHGIGLYIALLIQVESLAEGAQHIDQLMGFINRNGSRKIVLSVLFKYNLFTVDVLGMVRTKGSLPGYSTDDMTELRRTDAIQPCAENAPVGEDKTSLEEIIIINTRFRKPTLEEVQSYCQERNNHVDAAQFIDYYESKGWRVGRSSMKDWKACVRTWERMELSFRVRDALCYDDDPSSICPPTSSVNPDSLIPKDAPPRPSPTAQWDFATDSWNEFY